MTAEGEILNAKKWVGESNRTVLYGVCFMVAGAVGVILAHKHDLPTGVQVCIGGIALLVGGGMMSESNFYASRKHLQKLENTSKPE